MEIWTIKIECVFGCYFEESAAKICEIKNTYRLHNLCGFILESFNFDNDHMHEFFVSRRPIRSNKQIVEDETYALENIFPLPKNNYLFMNFDFGDNWIFKITRHNKKVIPQTNGGTYPRIIEHIGQNPEQYPMIDEEY